MNYSMDDGAREENTGTLLSIDMSRPTGFAKGCSKSILVIKGPVRKIFFPQKVDILVV